MERTAEPRLIPIDEGPRREPVAAPVNVDKFAKMSPRDRVIAALEGNQVTVLAALAGLAAADYRGISSWETQELAEMLVSENLLALAYPVYEGLALRHLDRAKAQYYPLALRAVESCRWISRELNKPQLFHRTYDTLQREHGQKNPIRRLRRP